MVDCILTPIFEAEFLGFSYGFRPGRGAHDALDALAFAIERGKVNWIVDADIRGYFDNINRDWLVRFVEHRIGDRRVVRLIQKWLRAGVMQDGAWSDSGQGTPQGATFRQCSPTSFCTMCWTCGSSASGVGTSHAAKSGSCAMRTISWLDFSTSRGGTVSGRSKEATRQIWIGLAPEEDPAGGIRTVRGSEPEAPRAEQAADI